MGKVPESVIIIIVVLTGTHPPPLEAPLSPYIYSKFPLQVQILRKHSSLVFFTQSTAYPPRDTAFYRGLTLIKNQRDLAP